MDKQAILALINANPAFFLATVEEGQPRVRGMLLYRANENGILFHTGNQKDVYRQLLAVPSAELCFFDPQSGTQVRVRGTARLMDDPALKEEIVAAPGREFLKPLVAAFGMDMLQVFRVEGCEAIVWTMETNLAPKAAIPLSA